LNKALDGMERVRKCFRFTESRESRLELTRYQAANDLLAAWLEEHTVADPDAVVPQRDLHGAYSSHCRQSSRRPASKQMFGRRLRALRPDIESGQRTVGGRRAWVYAGINLREKAAEATTASEDACRV
jgi:phage/plasmid-associated DNA primase